MLLIGIAIDVGANVGLYSVLLSRLLSSNRRVLAAEPTPGALRLLRSNLERNGCLENVVVFEGAVTDRRAAVTINTLQGQEEYSSIRTGVGEGEVSIDVEGRTIDDLVEQHGLKPGFIKIDTEGAELLVLRGGLNTLRVHRPVILSELADQYLRAFKCTSADVVHFLRDEGYKVCNAANANADISYPYSGEILAVPVGTGSTRTSS